MEDLDDFAKFLDGNFTFNDFMGAQNPTANLMAFISAGAPGGGAQLAAGQTLQPTIDVRQLSAFQAQLGEAAQLRQRLAEAQEAQAAAEREARQARKEAEDLGAQVASLRQAAEAAQQAAQALKQQAASLQAEMSRLNAENVRLQAQAQAAEEGPRRELREAEEALATSRRRGDTLEREAGQLRGALEAARRREAELSAEVASARAELASAREAQVRAQAGAQAGTQAGGLGASGLPGLPGIPGLSGPSGPAGPAGQPPLSPAVQNRLALLEDLCGILEISLGIPGDQISAGTVQAKIEELMVQGAGGGAAGLAPAPALAPALAPTPAPQEAAELRARLAACERQMDRLTRVYQENLICIRKWVVQTTGWRLDILNPSEFLLSLSAGAAQNVYLRFMSDNRELRVMQNTAFELYPDVYRSLVGGQGAYGPAGPQGLQGLPQALAAILLRSCGAAR